MRQGVDFIEEGTNGRQTVTDRAIVENSVTTERKKRFLLLVDGNARDLFVTGMILQRLEYDVYVCGSAEDALDIMSNALPTLVIADVRLPRMSGADLLKRIKQEPATASVPVILLTPIADAGTEELCLAYGCASFLEKPVEPERLYYAVQHASETAPRSYVRLKTFLPAEVGVRPASGGTREPEVITALSENGCYVRTLTPRTVNSIHSVEFMVERTPVKAHAQVLYAFSMNKGPFKEPGMGMKFAAIPDADRQRIKDFIKGQITKDIHAP
jgi:cyclic di-GMP phosphodiesterase